MRSEDARGGGDVYPVLDPLDPGVGVLGTATEEVIVNRGD